MSSIEGVPLSDQLEGALHPVHTPHFYGHDKAIEGLTTGLTSGRFHHGWIFSGPLGVGKATLGYHLARVLLDQTQDKDQGDLDLIGWSEQARQEKTGRLVAQFAHPDMRVLRRNYDPKTKKFFSFIRIDEMRALRDMLHTTPSMGGARVILIDRAEDMNQASGNALLKVLEEPPQNTVFILITNALGQIPITIRSRCRLLKFHGLELDAFQQALEQQFQAQHLKLPEDLEIQSLWHLSQGSVRVGFELVTGNGLKVYHTLVKLFEGLPTLDGQLLDQFVDGVLRDKSGQAYSGALEQVLQLLYRLIKGKMADFPLSAQEKRLADKLIHPQAIDQWLRVWDTVQQKSLDVDEYNLDKKTHLTTTLFSLRDLVRAQ